MTKAESAVRKFQAASSGPVRGVTGRKTAAALRAVLPAAHPFVKWAGGKGQLLTELRERMPKRFGRYYEPFAGGAAFFFDLAPERAVLNDLNDELFLCYHVIKTDVEALIRELRKHRYEEKYYYRVRARPKAGPHALQAARTIFLNRTGYNGLYRVNKKGGFNVPFGRYTNPLICDVANLHACAAALRNVTLRHVDFVEAVKDAKRGDFVYFDPPYVPRSKKDAPESDFTQYTRDGFTLADQERLRDLAVKLKKAGVHVMLSNADVPIVRKLYARGFKIDGVKARRNINSKADKREPVGEVIIT